MFQLIPPVQPDLQPPTETQVLVALSTHASQTEQILILFRQWMGKDTDPNYLAAEEHLIRAYEELIATVQAFIREPEETSHEDPILPTESIDEADQRGEEKAGLISDEQVLPSGSPTDDGVSQDLEADKPEGSDTP